MICKGLRENLLKALIFKVRYSRNKKIEKPTEGKKAQVPKYWEELFES